LLKCCLDGLNESFGALAECFIDEVGEDFGIRLRREDAPRALEAVAQNRMVLDNAVVYDGDRSGFVRMGVFVRGAPVRSPAGVSDT